MFQLPFNLSVIIHPPVASNSSCMWYGRLSVKICKMWKFCR